MNPIQILAATWSIKIAIPKDIKFNIPLLLTLRLNFTMQIEIRTSEMKAKSMMKKSYKLGGLLIVYGIGLY